MKEKVILIDDSEIEVECRYLLPRKAYSIMRNLLKIEEMNPIMMEVEKDGKVEYVQSQKMKGDFSGIIELVPLCVDEIVLPCPQKELISVNSMKQLYEKYAEKAIGEVMTSVSPKYNPN